MPPFFSKHTPATYAGGKRVKPIKPLKLRRES